LLPWGLDGVGQHVRKSSSLGDRDDHRPRSLYRVLLLGKERGNGVLNEDGAEEKVNFLSPNSKLQVTASVLVPNSRNKRLMQLYPEL